MIASEKYFIEFQLECVVETTLDEKIGLIKKINSTIERMLKDKKVIHYSANMSSISEDALMSAYVTDATIGSEN
jgi:hypothetical protein